MIKAALALVGFAVASQGATITRESSYAADLSWGIGSQVANLANIAIAVPKFDPALGTLTAFTLSGTMAASADIMVQTGNRDGDLNAVFGLNMKLKWPNSPVYASNGLTSNAIYLENAAPHTAYFFPGVINAGVPIGTACGIPFFQCEPVLTGVGSYLFSLRFTPFHDISLPVQYSATGSIAADFTATYHYEPTISNPEPASWALMAAGLAALAYYRRPRRA